MKHTLLVLLLAVLLAPACAEILIPMDNNQTDHLKAYGVVFAALKDQISVRWLLNYRGGSWLTPNDARIEQRCRLRGVSYEVIGGGEVAGILATIQQENMDVVVLEKEPRVAVYAPPNTQPWDDAVLLALDYAQIDHDIIWDEEVLAGKLDD